MLTQRGGAGVQLFGALPKGANVPKLTKRIVDSLEPKERRYYVWDSHLTGFGILVLPSGVKSYCFQYRTPEGRSRRATIGKHGTWTAEEARDKMERHNECLCQSHIHFTSKSGHYGRRVSKSAMCQ